MNTQDPQLAMTAGRAFITEHLVECCRELVEFDNTAILQSGRVREAAALYRPAAGVDALKVAINEVERQAIVKVAAAKAERRPNAPKLSDKNHVGSGVKLAEAIAAETTAQKEKPSQPEAGTTN